MTNEQGLELFTVLMIVTATCNIICLFPYIVRLILLPFNLIYYLFDKIKERRRNDRL